MARRPLEKEGICLDGGRRTTQLMRDSLGSRFHMDFELGNPIASAVALSAGAALVGWYGLRLRRYKQEVANSDGSPESRRRIGDFKLRLTVEVFVGWAVFMAFFFLLAQIF